MDRGIEALGTRPEYPICVQRIAQRRSRARYCEVDALRLQLAANFLERIGGGYIDHRDGFNIEDKTAQLDRINNDCRAQLLLKIFRIEKDERCIKAIDE